MESEIIGHMRDLSDHHVLVGTIGTKKKPIENTHYLELLQDFEEEMTECGRYERRSFRNNLLYILRVIMELKFVKEDTLTHSFCEIGDTKVMKMIQLRYETKIREQKAIKPPPPLPKAGRDSNDSQVVWYGKKDEEPFFANFRNDYRQGFTTDVTVKAMNYGKRDNWTVDILLKIKKGDWTVSQLMAIKTSILVNVERSACMLLNKRYDSKLNTSLTWGKSVLCTAHAQLAGAVDSIVKGYARFVPCTEETMLLDSTCVCKNMDGDYKRKDTYAV
eukprot:scaffold68194_cov58-Attheya_sp.AAC.6